MLLAQRPLTSETRKLTSLVAEYGLKIRLMNVNLDQGGPDEDNWPDVPSREGLDEDYYYDMGGN